METIDWGAILTQVLVYVLPPLALGALGFLAAKIKEALAKAKTSQGYEWIEALQDAAELAVKAAEQSKLAGLIQDKKAYALQVAEEWLTVRGIKIDLHVIDAAIEKAVGEFFAKTPEKQP